MKTVSQLYIMNFFFLSFLLLRLTVHHFFRSGNEIGPNHNELCLNWAKKNKIMEGPSRGLWKGKWWVDKVVLKKRVLKWGCVHKLNSLILRLSDRQHSSTHLSWTLKPQMSFIQVHLLSRTGQVSSHSGQSPDWDTGQAFPFPQTDGTHIAEMMYTSQVNK